MPDIRVVHDPLPVAPNRPSRRRPRARRRYPDGSLRHRLQQAFFARPRRWWDWGHPLMVLVGRYRHGDYEVPRGRDLWYRFKDGDGQGAIVTTYDYADVRALPNGEWQVFDIQNDGHTVQLGWWNVDGRTSFYGLDRRELHLFRRWDLWECRARGEWFGLRRWIYYRALHAAVHQRIPFTCQAAPPRGAGGYTHWHCELRPRHRDDHRFRSYTWPRSAARA